MTEFDPRRILTFVYDTAVAAAYPASNIARYLPPKPAGRVIVVGAGKAAAKMARALEANWDGPLEGLVVAPYGFRGRCQIIEVIEAAYPVPDKAGLVASHRLMNKVSALTADDLVIALISGGGSALLPLPAGKLTLEDETAVNLALLGSDVPVAAMNAVRKHISAIKGGRLAAKAYPARVVTLLVSDIPGNNPALVASGPTIPDDTTRFDALEVVKSYNLPVSDRVLAHLNSTAADAPLKMDPRFARNEVHTLVSASVSLKAAAAAVEKFGVEPVILSDCLKGEAREVGFRHAAIAKEASLQRRESEKPLLVLSGGETTATARPTGRGGRNSEFLLAFAIAIDGLNGINALAADTDGIDGLEDNAGAFADGSSVSRMRMAGLDARQMLDSNDSWTAFNSVRDLFIPGPTGTNVNDLSAILLG